MQESVTIRSFYLRREDGKPLDPYLPGQFIALQVKPKGFEKPVIRNYTLSDRPGNDYYRITVKKEPNGVVSKFLHEEVAQEDCLRVGSPTGDFYLDQNNTAPIVMLSGGVGITPMLSMLEQLVLTHSGLQVFFIHSSTNNNVQPMKKRLSEIKQRHSHILVNIHHSRPLKNEEQGVDFDNKGAISLDYLKETIPNPSNCMYYLCGPNSFMVAMYAHLAELGAEVSNIRYEFFKEAKKMASSLIVDETGQDAFTVKFQKSRKTVVWNNKYNAILELAESVDIYPENSCRMGTCLSCESKLLKGEIMYDPEPFMQAKDEHILICCAHPKSNLVIDL